MDIEQDKVVECQPQEKHPAKDVTPYVDRFISPPKYALQTHFGGEEAPVSSSDIRIKLKVAGSIIVGE